MLGGYVWLGFGMCVLWISIKEDNVYLIISLMTNSGFIDFLDLIKNFDQSNWVRLRAS